MNKILIAIGAVCLAVTSLHAANGSATDTGFSSYATSGTGLNLGTNYVVIPRDSATGGEPLVTYVNVTTFNGSGAAACLTNYVSTNKTTAVTTNNSTTLYINSTNGFVAGQWVVIEHLQLPARFRNEAAIIASVNSNGTNIVLATAPTTVLQGGDIVYQETPFAVIPFNGATSTTASITGPCLSGQRSIPMLLVLSSVGAGTNNINAVNAVFQP